MTHPSIQAFRNMQEELNSRLACMGQIVVQELLQPLWGTPIVAVRWEQSGTAGVNFLSLHRHPELLVDSCATLADGWVRSTELGSATRRIYEEKIADFLTIPNEVMRLTFGDNVTVTVSSTGITVEPS